ncbi:MAG: HAD-IA family hydrolase [Rubricella sp.]
MGSIIFDLDGTLADTSRDLIAAANHCLVARGIAPLDPVADALTAFRGGRAMLRLGLERAGRLEEALVDEDYPLLLSAYEEGIDRETVLYPGVIAALDTLGAAGYRLGICTNKPEGLARLLLDRLGVLDRFAALYGADTLPVRKPDPEHLFATIRDVGGTPDNAILIGDTVTDRTTGARAGVPVVLVAFGPEGEGIARLEPDALLSHYDELPAIAGRMLRL